VIWGNLLSPVRFDAAIFRKDLKEDTPRGDFSTYIFDRPVADLFLTVRQFARRFGVGVPFP
jgi:hypothetical protein